MKELGLDQGHTAAIKEEGGERPAGADRPRR